MLYDKFGRDHNYLRISVTDSCNFRCAYCMPEGSHACLSHKELMSAEEIEFIAAEFVKLGVTKIRLTGGEPLVRKDFRDILNRLSKYPAELTLTTNGALIHHYLEDFKSAGISTVNVSLDSLKKNCFSAITGRNEFDRVWLNILSLLHNNIRVKLNVVAIKGYIENEILDFVRLTKEFPLHVRFIEFMPFSGNGWNKDKVITADQMLEWVQQEFDVVKLKDEPHATAKKYKVIGHQGSVSFITTMSSQFCGGCNRLRITAEGKLKNCLFGKEELDLLYAVRHGKSITDLIHLSLQNKHQAMGGQFEKGYMEADARTIVNRSMVRIGG